MTHLSKFEKFIVNLLEDKILALLLNIKFASTYNGFSAKPLKYFVIAEIKSI